MAKLTTATENRIEAQMFIVQSALDKLDDLGYDENLDSPEAIKEAKQIVKSGEKIRALLTDDDAGFGGVSHE